MLATLAYVLAWLYMVCMLARARLMILYSWKGFVLEENHMTCLINTLSVLNYNSFDFFDPKFDQSSYLKNLCQYSQIYVILEELLLIKRATEKRSDILHRFLNKTSGQTWSQKSQTNYNLERIQ
jgi:hypothetical protein